MENNNNQYGQDNNLYGQGYGQDSNSYGQDNTGYGQDNSYGQSNIPYPQNQVSSYGQDNQYQPQTTQNSYGQSAYSQQYNGYNNTPVNLNKPAGNGNVGFSVASMVLGILSILFSCFAYVGLIMGLIGVALGGIALAKNADGKGMAVAGLVTGIIGVIWGIIYAIAIAAATDLTSSILLNSMF